MTLECECLLHPFVQEAPLLEGPHRRLCALSLQAVFRAYQESFSPRSRARCPRRWKTDQFGEETAHGFCLRSHLCRMLAGLRLRLS